jgi:hypothetical protein
VKLLLTPTPAYAAEKNERLRANAQRVRRVGFKSYAQEKTSSYDA